MKTGPDIVVIGAGLSGLSTAWFIQGALRNKGRHPNIRVFEAADRVGGRICTLRTFGEGLYAEAGAMAFSDRDCSLLKLIDALKLGRIVRSDRKLRCYRKPSGKQGLSIAEQSHKLLFDAIRNLYRGNIIVNPMDWSLSSSPILDLLDGQSIVDYFVSLGLSQDMATAFASTGLPGLCADDVNAVSAFHVLRSMNGFRDAKKVFSVSLGNDRLPEVLASRLNRGGHRIFLSHRVTAIEPDRIRRWKITVESNEPVYADLVILAVPVTALQSSNPKRIRIPSIPPSYQTVLDKIKTCQSIARVYCEVDKRFWYDKPLARNSGMLITDRQSLWVEDHTAFQKAQHGVLEAHAAGPLGLAMQKTTDVSKAGEQQIRKVYGKHFDRHLISGKTRAICWANDPFQLGAYPFFIQGERNLLIQLCQQEPVRGLFITGDFLSQDRPASMEGAVRTAMRLVKENLVPAIENPF